MDQEGKQYGAFHDFTNGADRFADYEIAVKQDPSFAFTETYLHSPSGKFWNSVINYCYPGWLLEDGSASFWNYWGWDFDSLLVGTHPWPYMDWESGNRVWLEYAQACYLSCFVDNSLRGLS